MAALNLVGKSGVCTANNSLRKVVLIRPYFLIALFHDEIFIPLCVPEVLLNKQRTISNVWPYQHQEGSNRDPLRASVHAQRLALDTEAASSLA